MYKSITKTDNKFLTDSTLGKAKYTTSLDKEFTSPMGLLNAALSSCISMCVRGYFIKKKEEIEFEIINEYENEIFDVKILFSRELIEKEETEVLEYIKKRCNVSKMLKPEVKIRYNFLKK